MNKEFECANIELDITVKKIYDWFKRLGAAAPKGDVSDYLQVAAEMQVFLSKYYTQTELESDIGAYIDEIIKQD